ncbi:magnesium transporter [Stigmatella aurantiaca]|uniref:Magnesium transporter MgtE n=1 Tax=Stigmatella aurantiaca (strain DW4/3-1) TaxID=378806 RepID=Q094V0_STIAD|nr:magnesium transporter [Stigmatella aurantiaca]ADO73222.1 Magnesium transporter [Stigmatella aurantiaca DW4/3-1]EAU67258.1 magnesium transporter [Stigmatella aurantiaca DW4/3-1]
MSSQDSESISPHELRDAWPVLSLEERVESFKLVPHATADVFFLSLPAKEQAELILALPTGERRTWMRLLAPDDAVDVVQEANAEAKAALLAELDSTTRHEVMALLAYAEDEAGGLMNPRFARVRPDMTSDEAIRYLRQQTRQKGETVHEVYVLDAQQHLLGVVSLSQLFQAPPGMPISEFMVTKVFTVTEETDQEAVGRLFSRLGLMAIPVVDAENRMKGIITVDDIVQVMQEEATEDIQKVGGMEALDAPYFSVGFVAMLRKRAGWLLVLFLGEMLTATAMGHFEHEIARAVVLSLFIPLIISSGGNSGSQATTLIIRSLALSEVRLRDWWRVARREVVTGLLLGAILGGVGLCRVVVWQYLFQSYGEHFFRVALTVGMSLVGVVLWGTLTGAMLPFALRRAGFDPASASAPFVATLVDVSGLVIYFTVASLILRGALL